MDRLNTPWVSPLRPSFRPIRLLLVRCKRQKLCWETPIAQQKEMNETPQEAARRFVLNTWVRAQGVSAQSQLLVKRKLKEHEASERKRRFGVEYLNLCQRNATDHELEACLRNAKAEVENFTKEINEINAALEGLSQDTKAKLIVDPNAYSG